MISVLDFLASKWDSLLIIFLLMGMSGKLEDIRVHAIQIARNTNPPGLRY